jgi:uncharacterized protein (TIRG00374 family)
VKIIAFLAQLIITCTILWYLSQTIDFGHVYDIIRNISALSLVSALALYCLQIFVAAHRLRYVLRLLGSEATLVTTARSVLACSFFGQTPLSNFGGDMVRVWTICRDGINLRNAASAVTIDRLFGFLGLVAIILCTLPALWLHATNPVLRLGIIAVLGIVSLGIAIFIALQKLPVGLRQRFRFVDWLSQVSCEFHMILLAKSSFAVILGMAVAAHFFTLLIIYILAREVAMPVTFFEILYLTPFPLLASLLPVSVGGWGVREGAMVAAFSLIGVPAAKTLPASILFGVLSLLTALPGSLVWFHAHLTPAKLRLEEKSSTAATKPEANKGASGR